MAALFGMSVPAQALCRRGLPGAELPNRSGLGLPRGERWDRPEVRWRNVRRAFQELDRGALNRPKFQTGLARACPAVNVEMVRRCDSGKFVVLSKPWIVERTIAWLNRCRRLSKDWERLNRNALAFLRWESTWLMLRRLYRAQQ